VEERHKYQTLVYGNRLECVNVLLELHSNLFHGMPYLLELREYLR
jgi:hypothetical protein